ncbi:sensor histidine kinase [Chitinimonas koreensis]|uniref:sensor histidine kinase n=1 Tax=Chitinimonas koreensis TaxID=356302 RepID=UPI000421759D|nr:histidine kinase [Chitinimonas koreensis]QNM96060.1 two-component sensor histidine kinase [Chitinimonas koreensis]
MFQSQTLKQRCSQLAGPIGSLLWLGFLYAPLLDRARDWGAIFDLQLTLLATALFLPLHFWSYYASGPRLWISQAGIFLIGLWLMPHNPAAHTLFIYAGLPGERAGRREAFIGMFAVTAAAFVAFDHYQMSGSYFGVTAGLILGLGSTMLGQREARRSKQAIAEKDVEIARLAKVAERERIARDLHDLLGHTLSLIALKAELGHKLAAAEPERAAAEMKEVAATARQALTEVRQAIVGLRSVSLPEAIERADAALRAAGVETTLGLAPIPQLDAAAEHALAQAAMEASTNIVRHASARRAELRLREVDRQLTLTVSDDGQGIGEASAGQGLAGMRERLEAVGGRLEIAAARPGTLLLATVPLAQRG